MKESDTPFNRKTLTIRAHFKYDTLFEFYSVFVGKSSQLGKFGFGPLYNLTWVHYHHDILGTDLASQIKSVKLTLIPSVV